MFNLKIRGKMVSIGAVSVAALTLLSIIVLSSNSLVDRNVTTGGERQSQLNTIERLAGAEKSLLLAAMDSIIDRADGRVDSERMGVINENCEILLDGMSELRALGKVTGKTAEAKAAADSIRPLTDGIQKQLVSLIEEGGAKIVEINEDFEAMDDVLDEHGEGAGDILSELEIALHEKTETAALAQKAAWVSKDVQLAVVQVQQWLTDISATQAKNGMDDGFDEAEGYAVIFRR
jgi:methyl-accepting chemotaxis protein